MLAINASEFKAKCLAILDEIQEKGESLIITKRGRAIVELAPVWSHVSRFPQDDLRGSVKILGDIVSPAGPDVESEGWIDYS